MSCRFVKKKTTRRDKISNAPITETHGNSTISYYIYIFVFVAGISMGFGIMMSSNAIVDVDGCRAGDVTM